MGPGPVHVRIAVEVEYKKTPIWNVIGVIKGDEEPNRFVVMGCHRDAWVFGAKDPIAGHSPLMEIARGLASLVKNEGWRPRRSIIFASWDAEEFGLIGSTEWAERWAHILTPQAVAYLNLDGAVGGITTMGIGGTPSLTNIFSDSVQRVSVNGTSLYDIWTTKKLGFLGAGSDQAAFAMLLGIPSLDFALGGVGYGVYHSAYDSIYWMEKFGDPTWEGHKAVAQLYGLIAMQIAETPIIPFDFEAYADLLDESVEYYLGLTGANVDWSSLKQAIGNFRQSAIDIAAEAKTYGPYVATASNCESYSYKLQNINDRLMLVERLFLDSTLSGHKWYKHLVNAPSRTNRYGGIPFPAISDQVNIPDWPQAQFLVQRIAIVVNSTASYLSQEFFSPL